jgi:hypothetical protein
MLTKNPTPSSFLKVKTAAEVLNCLREVPEEARIFVDIDDTVITPVSKTFRMAPFNKLIDGDQAK